ncbi:metallophosphoesterase [Undibacterium sp. RTI2.1]|uniref:metallophosphoesterase n=1 Tax=unclassified Undibacterium TaxID=2630295 RepID=UPI002AB53FC8|nr:MULTISPECIES: metallophosphoesterase [unclassified Undibacterium]MDY7537536.1 metallophosphoesterase [Undibacterium sp. 5I1]MEB0029134.1 metallophosphoesterase [Undibacterium sp. RTI2.1]MEB0115442.1 metallophosphoesterase [Undibacterium sp. RTI2.2]MEB0231920.1 metallophosphoesterase [Undibacterium sp. 10I3]MEB0256271.1 metallophosphoesterase [Undibacterium sp. 5I1]
MKPYGVISDTHNHNWSAFGVVNADGVNSRLRFTLDETKRSAEEVKNAGGNTLYHGGDLFHVRGSIAPSVLNPTLDCYSEIIKSGVNIVINAGNHDLESKTAARVSSAITALEGIGCVVINSPCYYLDDVVVIPWIQDLNELKRLIEHVDPADRPHCDLLLHAPIDGVIPGLPDHGLNDAYLSGLGFRRVLSGHYHHHKQMAGEVYSIGALTHQTWGDVDTKAGFLIVTESEVKWFATHAPSFVEIDGSTDPDEIPLIVDGNFVRVRIDNAKASDVESMRQYMIECGAKGVNVLQMTSAAITARAGGTTLKAGVTVEASINDFVNAQAFKNKAAVATLCQDILTSVRSAEA